MVLSPNEMPPRGTSTNLGIPDNLRANRITGSAVSSDGLVPMSAAYTRDTVLTRRQLAAALYTSEDTIERAGLPASYALGARSPRYIWGDVIDWLHNQGRIT
jgi:hypothetical protein